MLDTSIRSRLPRSARTPALLFAAAVVTVAGLSAGCAWRGRSIGEVRADAQRAYDREDYAAAAGYYREWLDRRPGVAEAQYRLGRSLLETGDPARPARR